MKNNNNNNFNLFELAEILGNQSDYDEILRVISSKTSAIFNSDVASILMVNPTTNDTYKTVFKKNKNIEKEKYATVQSIIIGWVIINKSSILIADLKKDERFKQNIFDNTPIKSAMCQPLNCANVIIGYIVVMNKEKKDSFSESDLDLLSKIAVISAPYLRNVQKIKEFFDIPLPQNTLINKYRLIGLLGKSQKFIELLKSIEAASKCDVRVVLEGDTGTGKELVVKAIHNFSNRAGAPFVAVDCGAIPNNLIESELFGHVRGAFTGANYDKIGLIREANKGTLFLDEICNLSLEVQSKLLRVLQEREVRPVGSTKTIKVNVRFIAASSIPLQEMVDKNEFRQDLFFRLMVYPIKIPSLNERKGDIPLLANHFLNRYSKQQNKKAEFIHRELNEYLKCRTWKGNIRELENYIEQIVTLLPENVETVDISVLPDKIVDEMKEFQDSLGNDRFRNLSHELEQYEKKVILNTLDELDWNQSQAARTLEMPEQTLRYRMKKLGIIRQI